MTFVSVNRLKLSMCRSGDDVTGYIFVLPEELQDMEQQIRVQIEQWQQQGQQAVEDLVKEIGTMIANAVAQQAQGLLDRLQIGATRPSVRWVLRSPSFMSAGVLAASNHTIEHRRLHNNIQGPERARLAGKTSLLVETERRQRT